MRLQAGLRLASTLLFILILPILAAAKEVKLVDASTGAELTQGLVRIETGSVTREYLLAGGERLNLSDENITTGQILLKTGATETFGYYAQLAPGGVPDTILLSPAGLVLGEVKDTAENLIVRAPILISCPTFSGSVETDATGRFRLFLPAERCVLSVSAEGRSGSLSVLVGQGAVTQASITTNRRLVSPQGTQGATLFLAIIAVIILVALLAGIVLFRRKRMTRLPSANDKAAAGDFVAQEAKHVLKEKEKLIVDELLLRGGTMSLRELRFSTQLPRTSLLRTLEGLEARNILVKKEEHGRLVVELLKK
jgi:uncharacterized membrane protein